MPISRNDLVDIVCRAGSITDRLDLKFYPDNSTATTIINSRIEEWCQVAAQGNQQQFEKRLSWDGIDLNEVRSLLGSVRLSDQQQLPSWANIFNECLNAAACFIWDNLEERSIQKHRFVNHQEPFPFEEIFIPFVCVGQQKLVDKAGSSYHLLSNKALAGLERDLLAALSELSAQAMELEFSDFRCPANLTLFRFSDDEDSNVNSCNQYQDFIKEMFQGGLLSFFCKYPVLARLVGTEVESWLEATIEFLQHLEADWNEIRKTFQPTEDLGKVTVVQPNFSDRHNNRRSVSAVIFTSGLRLIYKPKNLELEQAYFDLLTWLNQHQIPLHFKLIKLIACSNHGWVEFVETSPCKDQEQAGRYYLRAGILLCLAYILGATDLHLENLIACGDHPVLIDLETLMHPLVGAKNTEIQNIANQQFVNSVLNTGLLPQWKSRPTGKDYDSAGFSNNGEQEIPLRKPVWKNINMDGMSLGYEYIKTQPQGNVPSLNGVNLSPEYYVEELIDGFRKMYLYLVKNREIILADGGPLAKLRNQQIRFIFRPTQVYRYVLFKTLHPKFLRSGVDRSIQLDILTRAMLSSEEKHQFWSLLKIEQQALEKMDIPKFVTRSDSDSLLVSPNQIVESCFIKPGYDLVLSRLERLSNEDLERQITFISDSFYYSRIAGDTQSLLPPKFTEDNLMGVSLLTKDDIVKQALEIAELLQNRSISSARGSITWIASQYIVECKQYRLEPIGYSLYDGICGVALFFAALEKVTGGAGFGHTVLSALQPLRRDLHSCIAKKKNIGGAAGYGSIIYGLVQISQFLRESELLEDARQVAFLISPDIIAADKNFDVISGSAGAILGLLTLYNIDGDKNVLDRAIVCGYHLLNNRVASDSGYRTWAADDGTLLTGFSHGTAGIAYALLRLYQVTGETIFLEAAHEAIAYERSVFVHKIGNWPDFRQPQTKDNPKCMCTWCHGAPGIGLARIAGLDILDTDEIRDDIESAVDTTNKYNLSEIDHLCCGNLGRIELLFTAARKLSQPHLLETAMQRTAKVVARAQHRGTFGYTPFLGFTPGFFQGATGIGYQLLRLAYPDQLPSVLLWE